MDLAIQEKEQYVNVTRWFDHIQHYPGVRHHLPPVAVLRNRIYTSRHHWNPTRPSLTHHKLSCPLDQTWADYITSPSLQYEDVSTQSLLLQIFYSYFGSWFLPLCFVPVTRLNIISVIFCSLDFIFKLEKSVKKKSSSAHIFWENANVFNNNIPSTISCWKRLGIEGVVICHLNLSIILTLFI